MRKKSGDFIERSLAEAVLFLKNSIFAEEYASRNGFLRSRATRAKILTIALILLAVLFTKSVLFLLGLYILCLIVAKASSISLGFFLKRTWIFIPMFALIIAVPALFSAFSPGEPLVTFKIFNAAFVITRQGAGAAAIFFMRVLTSVSWTVLLALTTRHFVLLKALRSFGIPQIFVMTLGMCYRYIYLLLDIFYNTHTAIKSRVGFISSSRKSRGVVGWNMANLWQRSYKLQNDVYSAMLSRGYNADVRVLDENGKSI
ncbi:MAG: cobalt ECF transporter T component CbiQ [Candidatus Omnitrophica bacterium]|nr:cobalt ECF transporter T component CbiQ [Candidatus Omnitrophota bacterium]MBU4488679.1 cobalt ECF transporter T component CbiQ [Candidatus Omnitrophota bacterium]MCG2704802.1 cobalt ECF transporter T component CbiQ [Candidatus Omnitrophota bacterium]